MEIKKYCFLSVKNSYFNVLSNTHFFVRKLNINLTPILIIFAKTIYFPKNTFSTKKEMRKAPKNNAINEKKIERANETYLFLLFRKTKVLWK